MFLPFIGVVLSQRSRQGWVSRKDPITSRVSPKRIDIDVSITRERSESPGTFRRGTRKGKITFSTTFYSPPVTQTDASVTRRGLLRPEKESRAKDEEVGTDRRLLVDLIES